MGGSYKDARSSKSKSAKKSAPKQGDTPRGGSYKDARSAAAKKASSKKKPVTR